MAKRADICVPPLWACVALAGSMRCTLAVPRCSFDYCRCSCLQAPASSSHMPTDAGRGYMLGRPHPMSTRAPLTSALPRPLITSTRPMSSLWRCPPSTCMARPPSLNAPLPSSSSQAISLITEAKAKSFGEADDPSCELHGRVAISVVPWSWQETLNFWTRLFKSFRRKVRSSGDTSDGNVKTWVEFHNAVCWTRYGLVDPCPSLPLMPVKLTVIGSIFKIGGSRSANQYLSAIKKKHIEAGFAWTDQLVVAAQAFKASTERGIGPGRQSCPLPWSKTRSWILTATSPTQSTLCT